MASYLGSDPLAYLYQANDPWAPANADAKGQVFRNGVYFEKGVDAETSKDFFSQLGTWKPNGSPIPKPIAPGKNLAGGKYVITQDAPDGQGRDHFSPGADYKRIGRSNGAQIWYRQTAPQSQTPAPTTPAEPPPALNQAKIDEALARANAAKDTYTASFPSLDTTRPYQGAADFGRAMAQSVTNFADWRKAAAISETTEVSEASNRALNRFGASIKSLQDYEVPDWRDFLNPKKSSSSKAA